MNFEIENNNESEDNVKEIQSLFDCFDLEPKIPVIVVDHIEGHKDAKIAFCFDEDNGEMTNERYEISQGNICQELVDHEKLNNFVIHEVRHRMQRESEYLDSKDQDLDLFSEDTVFNINNYTIRNYLLKYINDLPDSIKDNKRELDSKICEALLSASLENNFISRDEINLLIKKKASFIINYLMDKIPEILK
ncbi:MAG: hypothetical protein PHW52_03755 [Candidatus Pacebacteria bacterium]|nr:hypothetical protein [Candidatus Paceibacterota bacterium]